MSDLEGVRNPRRAAIGALLVLLAFTLAYSWWSWREVRRDELRQMTSLAEVGARSLESYFAGIEAALQTASETLVDASGEVDPAAARQVLQRLRRAYPELRILALTRLDGQVVATSEPPPPAGLPRLKGPSFDAAREELAAGRTFRIGRAFVGPLTKEWVIALSYGVRGPRGELRYLLGAGVPITGPQSLWKDAPLQPGAALAVVRDDGYLVARYPAPGRIDAAEIYGRPRGGPGLDALRARAGARRGAYETRSGLLQERALVAFRRLDGQPLTLLVVNPTANVLQAWIEFMWVVYLLVALAVAGLAAVYVWSRRRQLAWDAEREARMHELQAANQELEAFNYTVSHDLRAPLRTISAFGSRLATGHAAQIDAEGRRLLGRVVESAARMSRQVDQLLGLSRLSRHGLTRGEVDLSGMARDVAADLAAADGARKVDVAVTPDVTARGDALLLRQLIENLLGNAWKFTSGRDAARIEFGAEPREGETAYYVRDDGAGFDMEFADKLFRPFERLHSEREFPGTGVGLAAVRRIVERHGGRVWADSAPGRGATFWFTLA